MMLSIRGLYQILAYVYEISELRTIQKGKLLFPIFFSHRLQPFFYYFHNSHEIKHFFPLYLFQKCFPTCHTCCVCRKTICEQLQFGIVCKPSIIESRLDRII